MAVVEISAQAVDFGPVGADALDALAPLYVQLNRAHPRPDVAEITAARAARKLGLMLGAGHRACLFRHGGIVLGYTVWMEMGDHLFIRNFLIAEGYRGCGLGRSLFARLRAEVWGPDREIRLEAAGAPALGFWQAMGLTSWSTGLRLDPQGD